MASHRWAGFKSTVREYLSFSCILCTANVRPKFNKCIRPCPSFIILGSETP